MVAVNYHVEGLGKALKNLSELGVRLKNKSVRKALTAGSKPLVRSTASGAPRGTGKLAKATTSKIKSYKGGAYLLSVVGARNRRYANGQNPSKYSHLVHDGHRNRGGKGRARANPYMRRAAGGGLAAAGRIATNVLTQEAYSIARQLGG